MSRSLINIKNNTGRNTDPCGTPLVTFLQVDLCSFIQTLCCDVPSACQPLVQPIQDFSNFKLYHVYKFAPLTSGSDNDGGGGDDDDDDDEIRFSLNACQINSCVLFRKYRFLETVLIDTSLVVRASGVGCVNLSSVCEKLNLG